MSERSPYATPDPGRVQSPAGDVEARTVYRVADWLERHGYAEASEATLGLISDWDPACGKPCCTERTTTPNDHDDPSARRSSGQS